MREKAFIYKAWEEKTVADSYHTYNAVFTATYNVNRKKNKRALKLWRKQQIRKADMEVIHDNLKVINEVEEKGRKDMGSIDLSGKWTSGATKERRRAEWLIMY